MTVSIDAAPEDLILGSGVSGSVDIEALRSDPKTYQRLESILSNKSGSTPLHERFRALFTLKSLATPMAVDVIAKGLYYSSELNRRVKRD
jgi:hypothetical protein